MTIINANKILNELSKIEEQIKELEKIATKQGVKIDFEALLVQCIQKNN